MAPDGRTCINLLYIFSEFKNTMAKPTEPDIATRTAPTIIQVKLKNGASYFNAPPFPSINAAARSRANVFNRWE
jgi:hypothetical protein